MHFLQTRQRLWHRALIGTILEPYDRSHLHQNNLPLLPCRGQNDAHAEERFAAITRSGGEFPEHGSYKRLGWTPGCALQEEAGISLGQGSGKSFGCLFNLLADPATFRRIGQLSS